MQTPKGAWDLERAAAWLRRHAWGDAGVARTVAPLRRWQRQRRMPMLVPLPHDAGPAQAEGDEIDIAGWPALVASIDD